MRESIKTAAKMGIRRHQVALVMVSVTLCAGILTPTLSAASGTADPLSQTTASSPLMNFAGATVVLGSLAGPLSPMPISGNLSESQIDSIASIQSTISDSSAVADAQTSLGPQYAGSWWMESGNRLVFVAGAANGTNTELADFSSSLEAVNVPVASVAIAVVPVTFSAAQLNSFESTAISDLQQARLPFTSIAEMWQNNDLVMTLPLADSSSAVQSALSNIPSSSYTTIFSAAQAIAASRTTFPPYQGGLYTYDQSSPVSVQCSSGFTMVFSGQYYGSTAGHCAGDNDNVGISKTANTMGVAIGNTFDPRNPGSTVQNDFTMFGPVSSHADQILTGLNSGTELTVTGYMGTDPIYGDYLCNSGVTTQQPSCAAVLSGPTVSNLQYIDLWSNVKTVQYVQQEFEIGTTIKPGDSGSPVYGPLNGNNIEAAGIASGFVVNGANYLYGLFGSIHLIDTLDGCRPAYS